MRINISYSVERGINGRGISGTGSAMHRLVHCQSTCIPSLYKHLAITAKSSFVSDAFPDAIFVKPGITILLVYEAWLGYIMVRWTRRVLYLNARCYMKLSQITATQCDISTFHFWIKFNFSFFDMNLNIFFASNTNNTNYKQCLNLNISIVKTINNVKLLVSTFYFDYF